MTHRRMWLIASTALALAVVVLALTVDRRGVASQPHPTRSDAGTIQTDQAILAPVVDPGPSVSGAPMDGPVPSAAPPPTDATPPAPPSDVSPEAIMAGLDYGRAPAVKADRNAATASVVEALKDRRHPERLTPLIAPQPFNAAAFNQDPQAYCDTVEPGRVFQSAPPGPDVPRLQRVSEGSATITQGASVPLQVQAVPGRPVTFVAFDGGRFIENDLNTVTVVADATGLATARYQATPGVIAEVKILASCPEASGQAQFCVYVDPPVRN